MIKDILVHLDGSEEDEHRLCHAEAIAAAAGAHITGLFLNSLADLTVVMPLDGGAAAVQMLADLDDEARRQGDIRQQRLTERFSRMSVLNEIRRIDAIPGELINRAVSDVRWSDLFVMSRPYGSNGSGKWNELFEAALFEGSGGIYVVPPGAKASDAFRRILIAWKDTRQTARAVAEAMPLIEKATRTAVVLVDADRGYVDEKREPGADLARHLDRHGTKVEIELVESAGRAVGEVILDRAHRMSADLVVMGAYGHSRAREWVLGGATVEMLAKCEIPLLLAH